MTLFVDYSWTVPTPAQIKAAGFSGVLRYLSPDPTKNLSPAERDGLLAAGLQIGLVWEAGAGSAGQGYGTGANHGAEAHRQASALGYPAACPLFYAVDDGSLSAAAVAPYFAGARTTSGYAVGVYGKGEVVDGTAGFKWQCSAWSGQYVSPHAHLYQRQSETHPLAGTDENVLLNPITLWSKTMPPVPPVPPQPPPPPNRNVHQTMLIQQAVHVAVDGVWGQITMTATNAVIRRSLGDVRYLQARVGTVIDGWWGNQSEAARVHTVAMIQIAIGVVPDGIWGPLSQAAWNVAVANNYAA